MAITSEKRAKMENLIYNFFSAFDKSETNTNYYKEFFGVMSDTKFDAWFKEFFENPKAYLILNIVDYENTIKMEDIERAAKALKVPLFENVYMPHLTMDNDKVVCTMDLKYVGDTLACDNRLGDFEIADTNKIFYNKKGWAEIAKCNLCP